MPPIDPPTRGLDGRRLVRNERTRAKKRALSVRALSDLDHWRREPATA